MGFKVFALMLFSIFVTTAVSSAGEIMEDLDVSMTMDFASHYMFRGAPIVDDPVLQPAASVSYKGFSFDFWGNVDLTGDTTDGAEFNELDFIWGYSTDLGFLAFGNEGTFEDLMEKVSVGAGYTFYVFPNWGIGSGVDDTSHEWYLNVGFDTFLQPSYVVYHDFDQGDGFYHEWGIGHSFDLDPVTVDTGMTMGLNISQWGFETSLTALDFSTAITIPMDKLVKVDLLKYVTVVPHINYSLPLDGQYDPEVYGGVAATVAF